MKPLRCRKPVVHFIHDGIVKLFMLDQEGIRAPLEQWELVCVLALPCCGLQHSCSDLLFFHESASTKFAGLGIGACSVGKADTKSFQKARLELRISLKEHAVDGKLLFIT